MNTIEHHKSAASSSPVKQSLNSSCQDLSQKVQRILNILGSYRRQLTDSGCEDASCEQCQATQGKVIGHFVKGNEPILCILPAFPGKSPNPNKVIGHEPDLGEHLALKQLHDICTEVHRIYPPGMKIQLCSDGRVFSDVVGMKESHVTSYQESIRHYILENNLHHLSTFNLDDIYTNHTFEQMRDELMQSYGSSLVQLKDKVRQGRTPQADPQSKQALSMYQGMTRFLFEDSLTADMIVSRRQLQTKAKAKAYQVILRSNAWSDLLKARFPTALRFSIHPQACGSEKFGIRLVGKDSWMTPWHGVVVQQGSDYKLMKRHLAEQLGAKLILKNNRPSHYQLSDSTHLKAAFNEL